MSYLSQPTSNTDYGVIKIGNYINVEDGIVSLPQDISPSASVAFESVNANDILSYGNLVVTSVTPTAGNGIALDAVVSNGLAVSFTINNTGVVSLIAGTGISLDVSTGNVTVSATGADIISATGVTSNYTATDNDEYIGVDSAAATTITLPTGIDGRVYIIKDERGQGSGKITVQPQSGALIDGKLNYVIGVPYQSISVVFRAGQWRII